MGMLQFTLGLMIGIMMGVFIMCLMIMAGRVQEPPEIEETGETHLSEMAMAQASHPKLK
jgi:uncharacterized protein YneF (UPF0154 family)